MFMFKPQTIQCNLQGEDGELGPRGMQGESVSPIGV